MFRTRVQFTPLTRQSHACRNKRIGPFPRRTAMTQQRARTRQWHPPRSRRAAFTVAWTTPAEAEITRIVITRIESPTFEGVSFGEVGQYEKLVGRAFGEVDPNDPRNAGDRRHRAGAAQRRGAWSSTRRTSSS